MAFVEFEQRGHVGLITINRPEVLNALNLEVIEQLDDILLRAESQEDVHVIVITGAGRSFVAGADIGEMVNYTADDAKRFSHHGNNTMMHITRFPSPVIAAVNGFALGGGCELAMSCDIRVASEKATFGMPEVGLGITPGFGGTQRLQRIVGMSTAMELVLTSRTIDAQEALQIGLVKHVYPADVMLDKALELAQASEFVDRMPGGIHAPIAEGGTNVSGGQKQRLSIARALARHPEILVFDDSFSALDYRTDTRLRAGLDRELKDTTRLIVAQRIGTIRNADKIIVLDEGRMVGMGTHEELMQTCPIYQEIARSQLSQEELGA